MRNAGAEFSRTVPLGMAAEKYFMTRYDHLQNEIARLRSLECTCVLSRQRFALYDFLASVYDLYVCLKRHNESKSAARSIAKMCGLRLRQDTHLLRVILDAASSADPKAKSR